MPNQFFLPEDDDTENNFSSPVTPAGAFGGGNRGSLFRFDGGATGSMNRGELSAPSSAGSFTPAGAPSASYLGSSMMRGMTSTTKSIASPPGASTSRSIFGSTSGFKAASNGGGGGSAASNSPLGRSIQGNKPNFGLGAKRQPSRLNQVMADDDEDVEEEGSAEESEEDGSEKGREEDESDEDAEGDDDEYFTNAAGRRVRIISRSDVGDEGEADEEDAEGEYDEEEEDDNQSGGGDRWLSLARSAIEEEALSQGRAPWMPAIGNENDKEGNSLMGGMDDNGASGSDGDLLSFSMPVIDDRVRKYAENIYRVSVARSGGAGGGLAASVRQPHELRYASIAKGMYRQMGYAELVEAPQLVRQTEVQLSQLYSQGVGVEEDAKRLDEALANTSAQLVALWNAYVESLPRPVHDNNAEDDDGHLAGIGPGPRASAFENAAYVATLALQLHHTRSSENSGNGPEALTPEPLTETLFRWVADNHNPYPEQVQDVLRFQPSPASHGMFWQTIFGSLLQGRVGDAIELLRVGGWQSVRRAGVQAYSGRALANVEWAVQETVGMLESCPGKLGSWDIWSSKWVLFRIHAKSALDQLRRFAEGGRGSSYGNGDNNLDDAEGEDEFSQSYRGGGGQQSMTGLARKAESQVPWDVYENLNIVFDIALGLRERILAVSQDWCEATLGLFGWWDESKVRPPPGSNSNNYGASYPASIHGRSLSISSRLPNAGVGSAPSTFEGYLGRLTRSFHATSDSGLEVNSNSPLEVALASIFEDNPHGLLGLLRAWSLPVAAAVGEIASLGGWLPPHPSTSALAMTMDGLDMEDLEVLGVDPTDPDDSDGFKDNTLVQYAQALTNNADLMPSNENNEDNRYEDGNMSAPPTSPATMDGWELAIHVLGRMNSSERAEETIGEVVLTILKGLDVDSGATIDKIWRLLCDLGMPSYAEQVAGHYGDLLSNETYRFGEAVWYYAIAHRSDKVREIMNALIAYSLIQSAAYPAETDLDSYLRRLLFARRTSLEQLARRDLAAAEVLGRLLSGYATLRHFYNVRDDPSELLLPVQRRTSAAAALTAVIASADDNIRGGLYDQSRDAVVSEDFLLALLGEALVFTNATISASIFSSATPTFSSLVTAPPVVAAETINVLLKAVEDLQTLAGSRVYAMCDDFLQIVLASVPGGLKGSTPADLLRKTTSNVTATSAASGASSSFTLTGSSMLASQLHRTMLGARSGAGGAPFSATTTSVSRAWDWRSGLAAHTTAGDVLQKVRQGVSQALARLWVAEADEMVGLPVIEGGSNVSSLRVGR
ncbi:hypothetical protein SEPCBS57363_006204 [Sporothrix epigloea]|uniref:Nuclear pore complex protein Nup85 n=1 Tax=Sporothrix epigloea TaxID=1892477 RepID=A0ABP0E500_9PEZI